MMTSEIGIDESPPLLYGPHGEFFHDTSWNIAFSLRPMVKDWKGNLSKMILDISAIGSELQRSGLDLASTVAEALWRTQIYARHGTYEWIQNNKPIPTSHII
jgi:hypothetical protein